MFGEHGVAGVRVVQVFKRSGIRHLPRTALAGGVGDRAERRPLFVVFALRSVSCAGLRRQHRASVQVARIHHAPHMAPHIGHVNVRAGDNGEDHAQGFLDAAFVIVSHHHTNGRFHPQT